MTGWGAIPHGANPPLAARTGGDAGSAPLVAPVAIRTLDLEAPLGDLRMRRADSKQPYRSLLIFAHVGGDPVGAATFSLADGSHPCGDQLARRLAWRFATELRDARTRRRPRAGGSMPRLPFPTVVDRLSPAPPSVSVVVATCANPGSLRRCVGSILASDYDNFELIVVENRPGSVNTAELLATWFPNEQRLRCVEETVPGASRSRNTGLACARGEIIAFTDDDVIVDGGWIRAGVRALGRGHGVACATGLILPLELESKSQVLLEQFAGFGKGFRPNTYRHPESRAEIPFFPYAPGAVGSGANTLVRTDVARALGGFDTNLGPGTPTTGGEDLELYIRLLRSGYAVAYEPSAIVWHQHPDGTSRLRRQVYRYGVGLGAVLAKQLIAGPDRRGFLRAIPAGIRYARDPKSRKNASKPPNYPRHLTLLERVGILAGPAAYVSSAALTPARHRRRSGPAGDKAPRPRMIVAVAALACAVAALSVAFQLPTAVRMAALLTFLIVGPGTAFVTVARGHPESGLVLGIGLASAAVIAQSMLWLGAWWPRSFLYGFSGVCLVALAPALLRLGCADARGGVRATVRRVSHSAITRGGPSALQHAALLVAGMLAWGASLPATHLGRMGGLGLLQAVPPTYFVAFALLVVGFVLAAGNDALDPRLLGAYVVATLVVLHATTAILYSEPRYAWVYKHLGVINLIASSGRADRTIDIYNNWPSFFAANAWLSKTSGLAPMAYAAWAQLFFNIANVAAMRFALRGVIRDERLLWSAAMLFVLGNWVGQDYLAPQAFGFVLSLVVVGLWLRCGPRAGETPPLRRRPPPGLRRLLSRMVPQRVDDDELAPAPLGPRAALLAGGVCFLAVVTSHQLSPVFLILSVGCVSVFRHSVRYRHRPLPGLRARWRATPSALAAMGASGHRAVVGVLGAPRTRMRSRGGGRGSSTKLPRVGLVPDQPSRSRDRELPRLWLVGVMAAIEVGWLALAWPFVHAHFGLIQPGGDTAPSRIGGGAEPGAVLSFYAPVAVMAAIAALALVGFVRRLRVGKRDLASACLVVAPLLGVALQSYGGEGPFRAYLFALPWLALSGAFACTRTPLRGGATRMSRPRLMVATAVIGASLLFAYFGQELANRIPSDDVAASTWYERHAPAESLRIDLSPNAPNRLTARYPLVSLADPPALLEQPGFAGHLLGAADVRRLERVIRTLGDHRAYVVLSDSQEDYARLNGLLPAGSVAAFVGSLERSSDFRLVYSRPTAWIFEYAPAGSAVKRMVPGRRP